MRKVDWYSESNCDCIDEGDLIINGTRISLVGRPWKCIRKGDLYLILYHLKSGSFYGNNMDCFSETGRHLWRIQKPLFGHDPERDVFPPRQYSNIGRDEEEIIAMDTGGGHYIVDLENGSLTPHDSFSK